MRSYKRSPMDTYGSFGFAKLYAIKRPETVVDVLYDRVQPFYQQHKLPVEAMLTDNGTEYKGRPMIHPENYGRMEAGVAQWLRRYQCILENSHALFCFQERRHTKHGIL